MTAMYTHTITIHGQETGYYTCTVSNTVSNVTAHLDVQIPRAPSGLRAKQTNLNSVVVSWIYEANWPSIAGFKISYQQQNGQHIGYFEIGANFTYVNITELVTLSSYTVTITTEPITLPGPSSTVAFTLSDFIEINGTYIPNHRLVFMENIGYSSDSGIHCHTNYSGIQPGGDWIAPDGTSISSGGVTGLRVTGGHPTVVLSRTTGTPPEGIYKCVITNNGVEFRTIFTGLYNTGNGQLNLQGSMKFVQTSPTQFILSCISRDGPATSVTWSRNSVTVTDGVATILNNSMTATFTHTLVSRNQGLFKVVVTNIISERSCQLLVESPQMPANIRISQTGLNSVRVSWNYNSNWPAINGFIIIYRDESTTQSGSLSVGQSTTGIDINGLSTLATYTITVSTVPITLSGPSAIASITLSHYILINQTRIYENDYVNIGSIGYTESTGIKCQTNYFGIGSIGDWIAPDGTSVSSGLVSGFSAHNSFPTVTLWRTSRNPPQGIYQCRVTKSPNIQRIYIGIYNGGGQVNASYNVEFTLNSDNQFTLTCYSTGGPATTVSWRRNLYIISSGVSQTTVLTNQYTASYTHTLTVNGRLTGWYQCTVQNQISSHSSPEFYVSAPSRPTIMNVTQTTETSLFVSWTSYSSDVTGFHVMYRQQSGQYGGTVVTGRDSRNTTLGNLNKGATYTISLVARSSMLPSDAHTRTFILRALVMSSSPSYITAGDRVTLTCSFSPGVGSFSSYYIQGPGIPGGSGSSQRTIAAMWTSQAGIYQCSATYNHIYFQSMFTLYVRIDMTTPVISHGTLIAGTQGSLVCSSTTSSYVDTSVRANAANWRVNGSAVATNFRITRAGGTLMFATIYMSDNGLYNCIQNYVSLDSAYVTQAEKSSIATAIMVTAPLPPHVTITSTGYSIPGHIFSLSCSANTISGLVVRPDMKLLFQNTTILSVRGTENIHYTLNPVALSDGGQYTCKAVINIPQAGINNIGSSVNELIKVVYAYPVQHFTYIQVEENFTFNWSPPYYAAELTRNYLLICEPLALTELSSYNVSLHVLISSVLVSDLHCGTVYNCSIYTVGSQGNSVARYHVITTPESVPSGAPEMFEAIASKREVLFTWSPIPSIQQNGNIANYTLSCEPSPSSLPQTVPNNSLSLSVGGFSPNMQYMCSMYGRNGAGEGPRANTFFSTKQDCYAFSCVYSTASYEWHSLHSSSNITNELMEKIRKICSECTTNLLSEQHLYCSERSQSNVTYRAKLEGTAETDASYLVSVIEEWVKSEDRVMLAGETMTLDSECPVNISSFNDPECSQNTNTSHHIPSDGTSENTTVGATLGVIVGLLFVTALIIGAIIIILKNKHKFKANDKYGMDPVSGSSKITTLTNKAYNMVELKENSKKSEITSSCEYEIPVPHGKRPLSNMTTTEQEKEKKMKEYEVVSDK